MTISEMLGQSGLLPLLGMCVVFGFLIILIFCMKLLHAVIHALKLDKGAPANEFHQVNTSGISTPYGHGRQYRHPVQPTVG